MSNKIYCLLSRRFFPQDVEYLKKRINSRIEFVTPKSFDDEGFKNVQLDKIEIILGAPLKVEILSLMTSLKFIQIPWTGVDNIEFNKFNNLDVDICNSHSNAEVVAEYGISLMFALIKKIPLHDKNLREGNWLRPIENSSEFNPPIGLKGKTITIVGFGSVGQKIAKFLLPFGVNIIAIKNKIKKEDFFNNVELLTKKDIDKGLQRGDIIFLTLPLTSETDNLISSSKFLIMKENAHLINISRGKIVNEHALFESLQNKKIAGAAIDTWYNYPQRGSNKAKPSQYNFELLNNVILSPHRAGIADGLLPHLDDAIENLNRYAEGRKLENKINFIKKY